ncbi:hypothetical protein EJV47_27435 [Hymenobacter gummosus]|uniref:Nucleotidyltransferase family protein n=1 Tax=Hymenobacter gummosus TaxID=1776032 RepID=A0A431TU86_9BACT|nr:hypothetical protein [Hymenobacter gummosus]RTQ44728.1 hypothetical protein EJV47_27435 [Hymenobacter gummosus]
MTRAHEQLYLATLRQLVAVGIPFVGLGTFALRLQCPALPRRLVADCDLQLPPDTEVLNRAAQLLDGGGWQLTLWQQPLPLPLPAADLPGKYYFRAHQSGAVLDCAYENDFWSWPVFQAHCRWHQGLPLLPPTDLLHHKALANRPSDQAVLRWLRQWQPALF